MSTNDTGLSIDIEIDRAPENDEVKDALLAAASGALKGVAEHLDHRLQERREGRKFKFKLNTPQLEFGREEREPHDE